MMYNITHNLEEQKLRSTMKEGTEAQNSSPTTTTYFSYFSFNLPTWLRPYSLKHSGLQPLKGFTPLDKSLLFCSIYL